MPFFLLSSLLVLCPYFPVLLTSVLIHTHKINFIKINLTPLLSSFPWIFSSDFISLSKLFFSRSFHFSISRQLPILNIHFDFTPHLTVSYLSAESQLYSSLYFCRLEHCLENCRQSVNVCYITLSNLILRIV